MPRALHWIARQGSTTLVDPIKIVQLTIHLIKAIRPTHASGFALDSKAGQHDTRAVRKVRMRALTLTDTHRKYW